MTKASDGNSRRKNRFAMAIRASLESLVERGCRITKKDVIANARFSDGRSVGKTTLYSRNEQTKEFVHGELLEEIDRAIAGQQKAQKKRPKEETIAALRRDKSALKEENARLVDQIVTQEAKLLQAQSNGQGDGNTIASQETKIYVLASVINKLTQGGVGDCREVGQRYERKYGGDDRLEAARQQVGRYLKEIERHRVASLRPATLASGGGAAET